MLTCVFIYFYIKSTIQPVTGLNKSTICVLSSLHIVDMILSITAI